MLNPGIDIQTLHRFFKYEGFKFGVHLSTQTPFRFRTPIVARKAPVMIFTSVFPLTTFYHALTLDLLNSFCLFIGQRSKTLRFNRHVLLHYGSILQKTTAGVFGT